MAKEKPMWCEHILWRVKKGIEGWTLWDRETLTILSALLVGPDWNLCPVCGKARPEED